MNFSEALILIKEGNELTRTGWNEKGMYVYYVLGRDDGVKIRPQLNLKAADGSYGSWTISNNDALAEDWELFSE